MVKCDECGAEYPAHYGSCSKVKHLIDTMPWPATEARRIKTPEDLGDWKPFPSCKAPSEGLCQYPRYCRPGERDPSQDDCRFDELVTRRTPTLTGVNQLAEEMLFAEFGSGLAIAKDKLRSDPIAWRIFECAIKVIGRQLMEKHK